MRLHRGNGIVVLVVDDDPIMRQYARLVIEAEGYAVLIANDGEEALAVSRQFPGIIHVVLSDVQMPKLNGIQLRERILIERPAAKVLLMSSAASPVADVPFIRKPWEPTALTEKLRHLLTAPEQS